MGVTIHAPTMGAGRSLCGRKFPGRRLAAPGERYTCRVCRRTVGARGPLRTGPTAQGWKAIGEILDAARARGWARE